MFVSSHLIAELAMFADDLVVVGAGALIAAEPLQPRWPAARPRSSCARPRPRSSPASWPVTAVTVDVTGDRLALHGTSTATVSQIAFDHRIQITEITEHARSLEEILIDMTGASAEFAAA